MLLPPLQYLRLVSLPTLETLKEVDCSLRRVLHVNLILLCVFGALGLVVHTTAGGPVDHAFGYPDDWSLLAGASGYGVLDGRKVVAVTATEPRKFIAHFPLVCEDVGVVSIPARGVSDDRASGCRFHH